MELGSWIIDGIVFFREIIVIGIIYYLYIRITNRGNSRSGSSQGHQVYQSQYHPSQYHENESYSIDPSWNNSVDEDDEHRGYNNPGEMMVHGSLNDLYDMDYRDPDNIPMMDYLDKENNNY